MNGSPKSRVTRLLFDWVIGWGVYKIKENTQKENRFILLLSGLKKTRKLRPFPPFLFELFLSPSLNTVCQIRPDTFIPAAAAGPPGSTACM